MDRFFEIVGTVLGGILIVLGLLYIIKVPIDQDLVKKSILQRAYIEKNAEDYAKCDRSIPYYPSIETIGFIKPFDISRTAEDNTRIEQTHKDFESKVKEKCDPLMKEYEDNLSQYKLNYSKVEGEPILFRLLGLSGSQSPNVDDYEPGGGLLFRNGGLGGEKIYTQQEIEEFYRSSLRY